MTAKIQKKSKPHKDFAFFKEEKKLQTPYGNQLKAISNTSVVSSVTATR